MTENLYSSEQLAEAANAAKTMEAMIGRLTYDSAFAADLANNPLRTIEKAGLVMDKEGVEILMTTEPERFDRICETLFDLVDSDFLHKIVSPSCDQPGLEPAFMEHRGVAVQA
ncbi:hypothetical protein [Nocardia wallacei]|uniref:hypothetical protein n=1 Tax=Nocardia wallacei TaxID=480035 RepID=UPI002456A17C|nr:hypothetical protein [Nocardia wallacei]